MNKRFTQTHKIYLVKYKDILFQPDTKITRNNTYNVKAFTEFNDAKKCLDGIISDKVDQLISDYIFKRIDDDKISEERVPNDYGTILYERKIRLIGGKLGYNQTKTMILNIEEIEMQ